MKKKHTGITEKVLNHMETRGPITSMEAFDLYGATRLSAIIFNLRDQGYIIESEEHVGLNRYGTKVRFVSYRLKEEPDV